MNFKKDYVHHFLQIICYYLDNNVDKNKTKERTFSTC